MKMIYALLALLLAAPTFAAEPTQPADCLKCHAKEELTSVSAAAVLEVLRDRSIPPHARFENLTEAEVAQLLEALQATD